MAYLVCIDPGHAKNTAGKRSFDGKLLEYEFNRDVAERLKFHLERHGVKTLYSCDVDSPVDAELYSRCRVANEAKADLFISIHANAWDDPDAPGTWNSANGWEAFYYAGDEEGQRLAQLIEAESIPTLGLRNRGIDPTTTFTVVTKTQMTAVLVEHGFYTNREECEKLLTDDFRELCAVADAKGILKLLKIRWTEEKKADHWAQGSLDYLIAQGIIETPEAWSLDTDGKYLALIAKLHQNLTGQK